MTFARGIAKYARINHQQPHIPAYIAIILVEWALSKMALQSTVGKLFS